MPAIPEKPQQNPAVHNNPTGGEKLSTTMVTNITIISIVGALSIILMLFGNFEGKFIRVFSTLILFGIFTLFTSLDTEAKSKSSFHVPISQGGNVYTLLLGLLLIWGTLTVNDYESMEILPLVVVITLLVRLGVWITQKVAEYIEVPQQQLSLAAKLTASGLAAATILFTLPIGLKDIFEFGESYWKFSVAVILFSGLTLSITSLLIWTFRDKTAPGFLNRNTQPPVASNYHNLPSYHNPSSGQQSQHFLQTQTAPNVPGPAVHHEPVRQPEPAPVPFTPKPNHEQETNVHEHKPVELEKHDSDTNDAGITPVPEFIEPVTEKEHAKEAPATGENQPGEEFASKRKFQAQNPKAPAFVVPGYDIEISEDEVSAVLPWPVFPDGTALPALENGRPDFSALQSVAHMFAASEQKVFGPKQP